MTLAEMRTAMLNRGYGQDTAALLNELLNANYQRVNGIREWPWSSKESATQTLTIGTATLNVPALITDLNEVTSVRLEIGSNYYNPDYSEPQDFLQRAQLDRANGTPIYWTFVNQQLRFWPAPDQAYTARIEYMRHVPDLTADTDVPVWPKESHEIIVWGAIRDVAFKQRDWLGQELADGEYQKRIREMMSAINLGQKQTGTRVGRSGFYDQHRFGN